MWATQLLLHQEALKNAMRESPFDLRLTVGLNRLTLGMEQGQISFSRSLTSLESRGRETEGDAPFMDLEST